MPAAPLPDNEFARMQSLASLDVLDSAPERGFDALVKAAALVCGVPISLISLIDTDRQWFKANHGLPSLSETPRDLAFCTHAIHEDAILEVEDASLDPRFSDNTMVTGDPSIRFYAGATLRLTDGSHVGTLCVIDRQPRRLDATQRAVLGHLATAAVAALEQRHGARARADGEARLASIIEGTGVGTWEWNVQGGQMRFNEHWARLFGLSLQEIGQGSIETWRARVHPDDLQRSIELMKLHYSGATPAFECELRMRHSDGHWVWVLDKGRITRRGSDGSPQWMFGIDMDITQRKEQEQTLRHSEQLLNRTGEVAGVGGWEVDIGTGAILWSDQTCRIYGVAPGYRPQLDEAIRYYAPEARTVIQAAVESAMAGGEGWDLELPFLPTDGRHAWVRAVGSVEFLDGKAVRLFGAFQDITERVLQRQALEAAHARIALATGSAGIGIWDYDFQEQATHWDVWMYRLYGVPETTPDISLAAWERMLHPEDRVATVRAVTEAIGQSGVLDVEFRVVWTDGQVRCLRSAAQVIRNGIGQPLRMVGVAWDVTLLRQLGEQLAEQNERLRVTLQSIGDAVITTDAAGCVSWLNPVAERLTGWPSDQARGRRLAQVFHIVHEETRLSAEDPVVACLKQGNVPGVSGRTLLISRDGTEFGIEDSAAPIRNDRGEVLGAVLVFHDVTEQRRLSGEMSHRAMHDALTGLVNRAEFEARLRRSLKKAHEDRSEHALMYIDLDQFKLVNDACGHSAGDLLLQQVSKLLAEVVRARDTLARLGGDEFGVILEHCTGEQAQRVAQQICDRMDDFRFIQDERRFRIGASIGLVPLDNRWSTTAAIMQAADTACYAAKEEGRNRVHTWLDTDLAMRARNGEMQWATRLEQALDENRFVLHAQRIQPMTPGQHALHAEVLLRLVNSDGSLALPGTFLPAAERFHLASRIDRWVLRTAIDCLVNLDDLRHVDMLCINLSGQSIGDRAFHRHAVDLLKTAGAAICKCICLEITETTAVTNMADAAIFVKQVRGLGVRVALDDFGAGASSFGYLKTLPVDMLKIDGQFIKDLIDDPLDDAAVRCFADVARVVGLKTVAEWVSSPAILQRVREIGIDYAQGFLLHRPEPISLVLGAEPRPENPATPATR